MYKNIPELLLKKKKFFGNKKIIFHGKDSLKYNDLIYYSVKFANYILSSNLKRGDKVCICMNKSINQIISIVGCLFANVVFVPILPRLAKENINHIILNSQSKLIITDKLRSKEIDNSFIKKTLILNESFFKREINKKIKKIKKINFNKIKKNDNAAIIYSSGSTGMPKGIVIPHINLVKGAFIVSKYLRTKYTDRILGILSFNFDYGLNQLWQCFLLGSSIHLYEYVFPKDLFNFIRKNKITVLPLMPVIMSLMFQNKINIRLHSIKYVCTSGGPVDKELLLKVKKVFFKAKIYLMYGLTEAFRSTFLDPKKALIKPNSIGQGIPSVKMHILNKSFEDCKVGEIGELVHRGGCISKGYYRNKKKTNKVFKKIKRFKNETVVFSGDLAKKDKDGDIFFVGRKDTLIKTAGYRVSPTEVEIQCKKIKNIKFVVACGVYDYTKGQKIICAYTTFNKKRIKNETIYSTLRNFMPSYMMPEKFVFFEKFSITGNQGKINRSEIVNILKTKYDQNIKKTIN